VKVDDMVQGLVQNAFQLFTAFHGNVVPFPVFGCVTSMQQFIFMRYNGADPENRQFIRSESVMVSTGTIKAGVFDKSAAGPWSA
jgi:hypothetical protein